MWTGRIVDGEELDKSALGDDKKKVSVELTELETGDGGAVEDGNGSDAVVDLVGFEWRRFEVCDRLLLWLLLDKLLFIG